ncbi:5-deoxy-glucuronate isomerase [Paenibacillus pasadenensis]|uniref:5-deoxy-glucuronate isomerase n=1 Tax=Paenibacillus pasadenensis TaxID=217090 RepID=UPI00203D7B3C|nr:5-deoxy-glucuronate isomerase [Paenibacillus pasadenensis]MCM3746650.1 5-deoxy-glucuronate isomerase [Paenibacillus pasadenensis]
MQNLHQKPRPQQLGEGCTLLQESMHGEGALMQYTGMRIIELEPGARYTERLELNECCVVALAGRIDVSDGEQRFSGIGARESVFERKPTDSVFMSGGKELLVTAVGKARVALCYAPAVEPRPTRWIKAEEISAEHRGKYQNQRMVHNILPDNDDSASSLLVVEVYTEGGNFSSYPPHKHDRDLLPQESLLEEIYYHEVDPPQAFVFQRVYTDDRSIDQTMSAGNGDFVLVPAGYHPVGVPDGFSSYYLNVMAGPRRIWKFHNDPAFEWIARRE